MSCEICGAYLLGGVSTNPCPKCASKMKYTPTPQLTVLELIDQKIKRYQDENCTQVSRREVYDDLREIRKAVDDEVSE